MPVWLSLREHGVRYSKTSFRANGYVVGLAKVGADSTKQGPTVPLIFVEGMQEPTKSIPAAR
jgi:hypothetical protein